MKSTSQFSFLSLSPLPHASPSNVHYFLPLPSSPQLLRPLPTSSPTLLSVHYSLHAAPTPFFQIPFIKEMSSYMQISFRRADDLTSRHPGHEYNGDVIKLRTSRATREPWRRRAVTR